MKGNYNLYTSIFKHSLLEEYRPGVYGCGFKSLAKRFKVKGGHKLIMCWYRQWDGTVQSLNRQSKDGRPRTMTKNEVKHYLLDFVTMMNSQHKPVNYRIVQLHIEDSLGKKVPLSDIQRYGKECGIKWRKVQELTSRDIDDEHWKQIAKFRKFLQRIHNDRLIFIDETVISSIMPPRRTLVAPAINRLVIDNIYLICDKSRSHNKVNMMEALKAGKCKSVIGVCYMPTASATHILPLDSPILHRYFQKLFYHYRDEKYRMHIANALFHVALMYIMIGRIHK